MIAKWPFRPSLVWWRRPDQSKFSLCCEPMFFPTERIAPHLEFLSGKKRRKHQLRHVLRQRRNRGKNERRWSTEKHSRRQRLIQTLGFVIVKAAAFLDLPVKSGCVSVVDLHAIDAQVVFFCDRIFCVDQWQ